MKRQISDYMTIAGATIEIAFPKRPQLTNARSGRHDSDAARAQRRARRDTKQWAKLIARNALNRGYEFPDPAIVISWPIWPGWPLPDSVAWEPSHKAAVDGLTLAGAWPDDDPTRVAATLFAPPVVEAGCTRHWRMRVEPFWCEGGGLALHGPPVRP